VVCAAFALVNLYQHPQPAGPAKGVVSLEAEKRPHRDENDQQPPVLSDRKPIQNQKSSALAPPMQIHAPAQGFPRASLLLV